MTVASRAPALPELADLTSSLTSVNSLETSGASTCEAHEIGGMVKVYGEAPTVRDTQKLQIAGLSGEAGLKVKVLSSQLQEE